MRAQEIPTSEWRNFLEGFVIQHRGWLANLDRRQHGNGSIAVVYDRPLEEIRLDKKTGVMTLVFGRPDGEQVSEVVQSPRRLKFLETEPGSHAGLEIESVDGTAFVMRFRSAMPPEMVDGLAA